MFLELIGSTFLLQKYVNNKGYQIEIITPKKFMYSRIKEIVSNNMSAIVREVSVGGFTYVVRKPVVRITERNYKVLQLLELLKDLNEYADNEPELVRNQLVKYIQNNKINRNEIDQYISSYPLKTYKFIYEMRLDNVFA